ncbi:MAG: hypothetical protein AABW67_04190 [Nanoarchaeota archaeon]|mgnify:CR=1 FL=1
MNIQTLYQYQIPAGYLNTALYSKIQEKYKHKKNFDYKIKLKNIEGRLK